MNESKKERVLICEDEGLTAMRLREELDALGYDIVGEAEDGLEAVRLAESLRPDVILMDIKMPRLDGIQAAKRIMASHPTAIVMLTAYSEGNLVDAATAAGATAYLVKPIESKQLVPALRLARRRFEEFQRVQEEVADLKEALETRKLVERAKGILMKRAGLEEPDAFRRLQKMSQNANKPLKQIATEIVQADAMLSP